MQLGKRKHLGSGTLRKFGVMGRDQDQCFFPHLANARYQNITRSEIKTITWFVHQHYGRLANPS
nr:hypothetical protein [Verminephrobacter aporrectodeae]